MRFLLAALLCCSASAAEFSIATFTADVTVPANHGMMGGLWKSKTVADPLYAKGVVLFGGKKPVAFVSVDWCEIRNDAYDRWREVIAEAAGTSRDRVLVSSIHQHDAPIADLTAQKILNDRKLEGSICDLEFHEVAVQRVAKAIRAAMKKRQPVTHFGIGKAKVKKIASNRRYEFDGRYSYNRGSSSGRNVLARNAPEGMIDPWLKALSFWNGDKPVAILSGYATHPMSYYRTGAVSADFPGLARDRREKDMPDCLQVYFSGASGNVTAGKYNDGSRTNRLTLANKLYDGMVAAWKATQRHPLKQIDFRNTQVHLEPRTNHTHYLPKHLETTLQPGKNHWKQCLAAMAVSWRQRVARGQGIDVPVIDFGAAQLIQLPGEIYVEYQLAAQAMRPDSFVLVAGFGESAPGYLPTEKNWQEKDSNLGDWSWINPGSEKPMLDAIRRVLLPKQP